MAQAREPLTKEEARPLRELMERARKEAERSKDWVFPEGSLNTPSRPKTSDE